MNDTLNSESQLAVKTGEMTSYGYYLSVDNEFYQVAPYDIKLEFGLNKLGKVQYAPINESIKLFVYRPDWEYKQTSFYAQELNVVNHDYTNLIEPQIIKHKDDLYELVFPGLKSGYLLVIRDINNLYAIGLGSISDHLVNLFNTTDAPVHAVFEDVKQALKSFPDNEQLKNAKVMWENRYHNDKVNEIWENILSKHKKFEEHENRGDKLVFARDTLQEINYYFSLEGEKTQIDSVESMKSQLEAYIDDVPPVQEKAPLDKSKLSPSLVIYRSHQFIITMAEIGNEYLLRFKGITNEYNGKVVRHSKNIQNESTGSFILKTDEIVGKENWNTFSYENDGWGGSRSFVYPPLINERHDVYQVNEFDTDIEIEDTTEKLFNDYNKQ